MKKIISLILAATMAVFGLSITATAESKEMTFPMTTTTGTISFKGVTGISTNLEPGATNDDSIVITETGDMPPLSGVTLVVEGERGRSYVNNVEYPFINYIDENCTVRATKAGDGAYWKLNISTLVAYIGDFLVDSYSHIYSLSIVTTGEITTTDEKEFNYWNSNTQYITGQTFKIVKDFTYSNNVTDVIADLVLAANNMSYVTREVVYDYPFLANTDVNSDALITRQEVECLSYSRLGGGEGISGFEGLASQVANFFNKQTNGTITFHVTTNPAKRGLTWTDGGVPSSQLGIISGNYTNTNNLIGLFFNYDTTGSLVSASHVDENGNIVFDISQVLNDIGGNSLSTIHSIYYGLIGGLTYTEQLVKGLKIDQVTLSYSTDNEVIEEVVIGPTTTTDITTEPEIEEVIDEEEETEETVPEPIDIDEEEVEIVTEETTIEPEVVEEEVEIISTTTDTNDENPHTGVALAVIPALATGAALVIFKKRK